MESLYYVLTWLCHRTCPHCYEDRFRPYHGEDLERVAGESRANFARVIANLPERLTYFDWNEPLPEGGFRERPGRIILAGGEVLLEPVRESVLYPALEALAAKYAGQGVRVMIQTTGDLVTDAIVKELIERGVGMISVSGIDAYHKGLEKPEARERLKAKLTALFESNSMTLYDEAAERAGAAPEAGPYFHFFGATPDSWIGPLWPRGRAHQNELSTATTAVNFCNQWSGGLNFLQRRQPGSEVSIDPSGDVFPCCIKTKLPIGNLLEDKLEDILDRLIGDPVYEAISMGHPERMGVTRGWSVEKFLEKSRTTLPSGRPYQNLCVGCDRFHEEVLMTESPKLVSIEAGVSPAPGLNGPGD